MDLYRVRVPQGRRLTGFTVGGKQVPIAPGEYHVHRLTPKLPGRAVGAALRFVGAHGGAHDVHVPVPAGMDVGDALRVDVERIQPPA